MLDLTRDQKLLIGGIIGIIIFLGLLVFFIVPRSRPTGGQTVNLEFWGVFDEASSWQPILQTFRVQNRNISVRYIKKDLETYEQELLNALASGQAPDIIMVHSSWLPKHGNKLSVMPVEQMTLKNFQELFPDVAAKNLTQGEKIYALPVWLDVLTLIYNKDLFNTANISQAPKTWDEFIKTVEKLTVKDRLNNIQLSGAAIGTGVNVSNASDILSALMLQTGAKMVDLSSGRATFDRPLASGYNPGEAALRFYTDFSNPKKTVYTWNSNFDNSRKAFAEGKTAMIFDYALSLTDLKKKAPNLRFGLAHFPQPSDASRFVYFADYWAYGVPQASKNQSEAWKFLLYLTERPLQEYFAKNFGRPASRRDLIPAFQNDPDLGVLYDELLSSTNWFQADKNAADIIFKDAIDSVVLFGTSPYNALKRAAQQITQLIQIMQNQ